MRLSMLFLVILCLPLSAGEHRVLEDAVGSFASEYVKEREDATRAVREHLDRVLAPLLNAMTAEDPEVARRAREVIRGLLPDRSDPVALPGLKMPNFGQFVVVGGKGAQFWVQNMRNGAWIGKRKGHKKHIKRVIDFGIGGYPCTQALLRRHLGLAAGRGFVVQRVTRGSPAGKVPLLPHDIIIAIDGLRAMQFDSLYSALGKQDTWLDRTFTLMRNGKIISVRGR